MSVSVPNCKHSLQKLKTKVLMPNSLEALRFSGYIVLFSVFQFKSNPVNFQLFPERNTQVELMFERTFRVYTYWTVITTINNFTKPPELIFVPQNQNNTFMLILVNIKMNIKIYWPKTNTFEQKIKVYCIVQN